VRASNVSSDDLQWWIAELNLRLSELEKLTVHFAPWASTKFRMLRATAEQQAKWIAELSLASADRIYSEIAESLSGESEVSLHEGAAENTSRELLREALAASRENAAQATTALNGIAAYSDELASGMDFSFGL